MPDAPSDPSPDKLPGLSLAAHEALALLAGTGLARFFDCLPGTVWMTDPKLTLTFVQGQLLHTLHLSADQLLGRTLPDLLLDGREDHPLIQGHHTALAGHETSVRIEWGGNLYNARIAPLRDDAGAIIGCVGSHQQIGWLPDDDGLLRESDMRLRRIIDSNMIGIAFGDDEGQITEANEAFLQLAGYTREDLVADGISWPALTPVEYHPRQLAAIDEVRQTGRCTPFEVDLLRKDGTRVPVMVGGARLSARRREGVAFVLDISERRMLGRRLSAELTCVDALLEAGSLQDAAERALAALCRTLDWEGAQCWVQSASGAAQMFAEAGRALDVPMLEPTVERAMASRERQATERRRVIALPILLDGESTAALVVAGNSDVVDPAILETTQAIGVRIQKFLRRARD